MSTTKRDLHADLAICNAASPGPWVWTGGYMTRLQDCDGNYVLLEGDRWVEVSEENERFIAEARIGWPHAILRALAAEAEVERLKMIIRYAKEEAREFIELREDDIEKFGAADRLTSYYTGEKCAYEHMARILERARTRLREDEHKTGES